MSSWKRATKTQKTHRERHQPEFRKHLGLLEKKKDYVLRAKDYNEKQETLKVLRKRALNKNPDEFYFHMINSKIEDGIHREKEKEEEHTEEQLSLMETQDLKYVAYKRNLEAKKVDKLQSRLHMIDATNEIPNTHLFFVDDDKEAKTFDIAKRLNTHPALLTRRTNRPKLETLKSMNITEIDEKVLDKIKRQKEMSYNELSNRMNREHQLTVVQQKMELQRALNNKKVSKPKKVVSGSKDRAAVYKWKFERQK